MLHLLQALYKQISSGKKSNGYTLLPQKAILVSKLIKTQNYIEPTYAISFLQDPRDIPCSGIEIAASEWALNGLAPPHSKIICIPEEK